MGVAADSKSHGGKAVKVRLLSSAPSAHTPLPLLLRIRTNTTFELIAAFHNCSNELSSNQTLTPRYFHAILSYGYPPEGSPLEFASRTASPYLVAARVFRPLQQTGASRPAISRLPPSFRVRTALWS